MILKFNAIPLLLVAICHTSKAWTMLQTSKVIPGATSPFVQSNQLQPGAVPTAKLSLTTLFGTSDDGEAPKRKRKRKKKVQVVDVEDDVATTVSLEEKEPEPAAQPEPAAPVLDLKPREDTPVQLEVKNILASDTEPEPSTLANVSAMLSSIMGSKDKVSYGKSKRMASAGESSSVGRDFEGRPLDDSLAQLLDDAAVMTEEEKEAMREGGFLNDSEGSGIKEMIGNALSTIVTADFFVVLAFLGWFLLGIFSSYILKDDTIQIAFNNNFETLVQPALGVLMIATIGGNFFKGDEQEYDL
jgi:hypothetical protein